MADPAFDDSPLSPDFIAGEIARRKTYYLLVYAKGPADRSNLPLLEKRRAEHVEYLYKLRRHGALVLHGPMNHPKGGPDYPMRGICIFAAGSLEEVKAWGARDPMVKEGFLTAEAYPFNGHPGDALPR
jgi:uncharacterized protein YciI